VELLREVAVEMTREAKAKKVHVLLGPTVNIARSPLCGRGFEFMGGEDPYLAGTLAAAFVDSVQTNGISTCIKHFVSQALCCFEDLQLNQSSGRKRTGNREASKKLDDVAKSVAGDLS
jgi:hypothetical protein